MRLTAALPLILLATVPSAAIEPLMPPHIVGEMFCAARLAGDMTIAEPYLTNELRTAIDEAMRKNDAIQKQYPDEKPPLGDGVPWASYQDAPTKCLVDYDAAKADPTQIRVTYEFDGAPDATFTDTLILEQVRMDWQIADLAYDDGSRLTAALVSPFEP